MAENLAFVPDQPVRVKITYPDGSWAKATLARVPHESEILPAEHGGGEKYEVLEDEPAYSSPGVTVPTEYGKAPAKKAASSSKETDK
jgi:hypothetical protein